MRFRPILAACLPAFLLAGGCHQTPKTDPNAKAAGGEVLPGSVSDAMIDLDGSTAEPPLAPHQAGPDDKAAAKAKPGKAAAESTATQDGASAAETPDTAAAPAKPSASPKAKPSASPAD